MSDSPPQLLFVDAYDSFSENIIALLRNLLDVVVYDIKIDTDIPRDFGLSEDAFFRQFHAIVLGPGPGNPLNNSDVGLYKAVWRIAATHSIPVLGICLGFQSLCIAQGMEIRRLQMPCHGHAKAIRHRCQDIFRGSGVLLATCYNSLGVRLQQREETLFSRPSSPDSGYDSKPVSSRTSFEAEHGVTNTGGECKTLEILAWDDDGWIQAVKHLTQPFWGLQFHPESCKSNEACHKVLQNWWNDVETSNAELRPPLLARSMPSKGIQRSAEPVKSELDHMSAILAQLTPLPSTDGVQYEELQLCLSRNDIANLCYELSLHEHVSMLESSKKGRYSIYAVTDQSTWTLEYAQNHTRIITDEVIESQRMNLTDAMSLVEAFMSSRLILDGPEDSPFWAGLVGYFSYELGLDLLNIADPLQSPPPRDVPDYSLMWVERSIVVDKETGTIYVQSVRPDDAAWIASTSSHIKHLSTASAPTPSPKLDLSDAQITPPSHAHYTSLISQCQDHLHAGSSYELCLTTSTPLSLPALPPFSLHQHLLRHNPSPYSALLLHPSITILSSSPEQFLSWPRPTSTSPDTSLSMMPMKGTLAKTPGMTAASAAALLATPKEEAENLMIVDLIRHDLHRALNSDRGRSGSSSDNQSQLQSHSKVQVIKLFELVEAETVYQLISHIRGTTPAPPPPSTTSPPTTSPDSPNQHNHNLLLKAKRKTLTTALTTLRATLPPGSMTGAPKKRSCEILRGLENRNRGAYAGVLGYLDVGGGGSWSVGIRCAFSPNTAKDRDSSGGGGAAAGGEGEGEPEGEGRSRRQWHVGAGGAITVLSDVEGEWDEMRVKMESVLRGFRGG
ncbi:aminodeoxychorismate synthase [Cyphellophora europaea CBS 101466]|uniref:aminodeoxychorismate synthase n=1 Tax=Cyphellophora europaea (strain CBS 101466) TaxID=1220924 RepID=W2RX33_CYPE1|nr:aminodeoxychorismate synthase [Cyphellophora europaea CBS 101466]ETN40259.1 aminodeoxychorismate synthase [Cyphellophora europaea CBS 101466]